MRLFRATAKPLERVPVWSNCCPAATVAHIEMIASGEILLDLDRVTTETLVCVCGAKCTEPSAPDVSKRWVTWVHLEDCDIDEVESVMHMRGRIHESRRYDYMQEVAGQG